MPHDDTVSITVTEVGAAVPLAQPVAERIGSRRVTTLQFMQAEPSALGRLFKRSGDGITVTVDPSPVPGGAFEWATQVRLPRRTDLDAALARSGLEWPVWWAVGNGDMTTLVEKIGLMTFVGFASPELALPWFVRLHAAATGCDPMAPLVIRRTIDTPRRGSDDDIDDLDDLVRDVADSEMSDARKREAYAAWTEREAEWQRRRRAT